MYNEKIDRLIEGWHDEILEKLAAWLAIDSTSGEFEGEGMPFGQGVRRMLDLALADAKGMGFETRNIDGYAGDISLGQGEKTMGMLAHLDTVPVGDGWTRAPFGGEIADGKIYGRGAIDDKGPALAALYALRAVKEAGIPLKDGVRLILGCDEETGMRDMSYYAEKVSMPDYGFSPDAEYPLINIEKGGLKVVLSAESDGEPEADIPIYELYAGERANVVPGVARAVVGTQKVSVREIEARVAGLGIAVSVTALEDNRALVEVTGVSAHASMPHLGVNAVGLLFQLIRDTGMGGGIRDSIGALVEKIGMETDGKSLGIAADDAECGPLTCNIGLLRFDGRALSVTLDLRYPLATSEEKILGQMVCGLTDTPLAVRRAGGHTVHYVPADHKVVKGLLSVYHDMTGLPAYPIAIGGGTYSRMMPDTVAFGINFPGDVDTCHMPDEYIELDKFMLSIRIFAHAIEKLAGA